MANVLITGGSRGIGAACVRAFCQKGDRVVFLYRSNHEKAEALEKETGAVALQADISDPLSVDAAVQQALERMGRIDVLVNNAGISQIKLFTDLTDAEGHLAAGGAGHVLELNENTLCGLGTEVDGVGGILGNTDEGLEHQVELTDGSEVTAAAGGANDVLFLDVVHHLIVGPTGGVVLQAVLEGVVLDELVGSVAGTADLAVHEGVGEAAQVARSNPGLGIHDDGGIQAYVVLALLNEFLPPSALDVVLELNAEGAVVPGVGETAVDLRAGEDEAAVFAKRDDFVHSLCGIIHDICLPFLDATGCGGYCWGWSVLYHTGRILSRGKKRFVEK